MAIIHEGPAPYAPVAHVLRAIEHYREKAPAAFSKELLMRLGYPEAYARRTIAALKLLDLIDDEGQPTAAFKELRLATSEEYVPRLEQIIRTAYADAFTVIDPAADSDQAINDAFRFYQPAAQRDKMVTLFMGLAEAAGIIGADRAPRKRMRTVRTTRADNGRARAAEASNSPPAKPKAEAPDNNPPPFTPPASDPPAPSSAEALRLRYVDMLMKKAEAQDDPDTELLDRIEAALRFETRPAKDELKD